MQHRHPGIRIAPNRFLKLLFASGNSTLQHAVMQQALPGGRLGGAPCAGVLAAT